MDADEGEFYKEQSDCKQCRGTGEMVTHTSDQPRACNVCGGSGKEPIADEE